MEHVRHGVYRLAECPVGSLARLTVPFIPGRILETAYVST